MTFDEARVKVGKERAGLLKALAESDGSSALPPSEPQGACERSGLATCSLPVSSVKKMISTLVHASGVLDEAMCPYAAEKLSEMAAELRAELEHATSRQPRENTKISHAENKL